jgi:hypothetical protein
VLNGGKEEDVVKPQGRWWEVLTVDLLKSKLLSLADEAEDHEPCDEVETSIEANYCHMSHQQSLSSVSSISRLTSSSGRHDGPHTRECQTENTSCVTVSIA